MLEPPLLGDRPSRKAVRIGAEKVGSLTTETSPGIGLGIEHRVRDRSVVGHALVLSESVVHCSAFWRKRKQGYERGIPQTRTIHVLREAWRCDWSGKLRSLTVQYAAHVRERLRHAQLRVVRNHLVLKTPPTPE